MAGIIQIKEQSPDGIAPHWSHAVRKHQPTRRGFDRRSAVADLNQLPRSHRRAEHLGVAPIPDVVGPHQVAVLTVEAREHRVLAADPAGKQRHPLVLGTGPVERRDAKCEKVPGLDELGQDLEPVERGVGRVVGDRSVVVYEPDEPRVLHPLRLPGARGEDDPLRYRRLVRIHHHVVRGCEDVDHLEGLMGHRAREVLLIER